MLTLRIALAELLIVAVGTALNVAFYAWAHERGSRT